MKKVFVLISTNKGGVAYVLLSTSTSKEGEAHVLTFTSKRSVAFVFIIFPEVGSAYLSVTKKKV